MPDLQRSRLANSIDSVLAEYELPVFESRTSHRVAYEEAGGMGVTVLDLASRTRAAREVEAITTELLEFINHG